MQHRVSDGRIIVIMSLLPKKKNLFIMALKLYSNVKQSCVKIVVILTSLLEWD